MTETPVANVGDEAMITHTRKEVRINGIYFRRGAVLVKVGVHQPTSEAPLTAAGKIIVIRM